MKINLKERKGITLIVIVIILIMLYSKCVYAGSLKLTLSANSTEIVKGNNVKITVDWKNGMQAADYVITYDSSKLKYVSSSIEDTYINSSVAGKLGISWFSSNNTDLTKMDFTFTALETGTAKISVTVDGGFSDGNMNIPDSYDVTTSGQISLTISEKAAEPETKKDDEKNNNQNPIQESNQEDNKQPNNVQDEKTEESIDNNKDKITNTDTNKNAGNQANDNNSSNVKASNGNTTSTSVKNANSTKVATKDETTANKTVLPKTGDNFAIVGICGINLLVLGAILYRKYYKYKGI